MRKHTISLYSFLLVVFAGLAWAYISFRIDLDAAQDRLRGTSKIIQTKSGPIEYAEAGSGPVVLMVHGAGGGFDQGIELGTPLVDRGYHVIAMSRFGYLRTPTPADATLAAQVDAHSALLDALKIKKVTIMGVSAGGPSALQFAIQYPNRTSALILMVPLTYKPPDVQQSAPQLSPIAEKWLLAIVGSDFVYWTMKKLVPQEVYRIVLAVQPEIINSASEIEKKRVVLFMNHILPISQRVIGIKNDAVMSSTLEPFDLKKVIAPTLLLIARDDLYGTFASSQYTAERIAGSKFIAYDVGGHMLVGHFDNVFQEINQFLKLNTTESNGN
jgi:2-hydroxy-6-oxonona-2,4-dienedioate hydrolase